MNILKIKNDWKKLAKEKTELEDLIIKKYDSLREELESSLNETKVIDTYNYAEHSYRNNKLISYYGSNLTDIKKIRHMTCGHLQRFANEITKDLQLGVDKLSDALDALDDLYENENEWGDLWKQKIL